MISGLIVLNSFIAVVAVALGLFLLLSQGRDRQRTLFALLNLIAAVWILSNYLGSNMINSFTQPLILTDYMSGAILGFLFWLFSREMRERTLGPESFKPILKFITVPSLSTMFAFGVIVVVELLILTGSVVIVNADSTLTISNGPLYILYPLAIFALVIFGISHLIRAQIKSRNAMQRKRLGLILTGLLIAFLSIAVPNLIFVSIFPENSIFLEVSYNSAYVGILVFLVLSTYAIVRHGLFDIKLAAVRSAAYILVLLTLSGIYYSLAYLVSITLFQGQTTSVVSISPVNIALALVLAFLFQPIKQFFDRVTNNIFFRDRYDTTEFYARLSGVLTSRTDLRGLLQRAAREIGETLKSDQAFFFVHYGEGRHSTAGTARHTNIPISDIEFLDGIIDQKGDEVIVTELLPEGNRLRRLLVSHKVAILMPLIHERTVLGYLALGDRLSGTYTKRDIRVLATISDELIIGIQNALSVQEVKDINAHLQQRIDAATAELRTSNARLKRVDAVKDEFLSMASHQLRTPLTSVKGYLSMVLEEDLGKVPKNQRHVLEEAYISSERMVHLIHDFLNVSRLQTGKFVLEKERYDIAKLVEEEVNGLKRVAEGRNMKLELTNTAGSHLLSIDTTKIRQVVMNFIDNAIYYSHPDTTIKISLSRKDDQLILKVKDTGIGVPKSEQPRLFNKFYRATNARKQRPDGTGVGLFLSKKVATAHGGDVIFESKEGKGSTFGFWLPLGKLSAETTESPAPAQK